jgi:hypothetical protein
VLGNGGRLLPKPSNGVLCLLDSFRGKHVGSFGMG